MKPALPQTGPLHMSTEVSQLTTAAMLSAFLPQSRFLMAQIGGMAIRSHKERQMEDAGLKNDFQNQYQVGQCWAYEAPRGFEKSRILIGAILTFAHSEPVICTAITHAPMIDDEGRASETSIPFLPFSKTALDQTVTSLMGEEELPDGFLENYQRWKECQNGLRYIDQPFKGMLGGMASCMEASRQQQKADGIECPQAS